jgi:hypothetical protein
LSRRVGRCIENSAHLLSSELSSHPAKFPILQQCIFGGAQGEDLLLPSESAAGGLFIQGGTVVNADWQRTADVYIEGGLIKAVGPGLKVSMEEMTTFHQYDSGQDAVERMWVIVSKFRK